MNDMRKLDRITDIALGVTLCLLVGIALACGLVIFVQALALVASW